VDRDKIGAVMRQGVLFVVAAALAAGPGTASAADGDIRTRGAGTLTQETVGVELTPISILPNPGSSLIQAGPGAALRLFRHRWQHFYAIPIQAGLYVGLAGSLTFFSHVQTEGGVIVPGTARRLELGLGAGLGALLREPAVQSECGGGDGFGCSQSPAGGAGWMVSVVARYLIVDRADLATGVAIRWIPPPGHLRWSWFDHGMLLVAFDFAFGRPSDATTTASSPPGPTPPPPVD
jgi:hypothetical protein